MNAEELLEIENWAGSQNRAADYAEVILNRAKVKKGQRPHLQPIIEAGVREALREARQDALREARVRYCPANGSTREEMRSDARKSPLFHDGDMVLVWVNEGDIIEYGEEALANPNQTADKS